ncbi:hypothetical protein SEA_SCOOBYDOOBYDOO_260 [Mycobacterium phage ScoobyDoobyDoo]|nr:hypothetical protein SEA_SCOOBYDOOBYDOO_260 [Mycobacterium phage ScoobyDoobyDoo]
MTVGECYEHTTLPKEVGGIPVVPYAHHPDLDMWMFNILDHEEVTGPRMWFPMPLLAHAYHKRMDFLTKDMREFYGENYWQVIAPSKDVWLGPDVYATYVYEKKGLKQVWRMQEEWLPQFQLRLGIWPD